MGACLATPRDDAADAFEAPALDWKRLDAVERRADPTPSFAVASELKLRMAAAAKEARSGRFRYNGGVVDGTDFLWLCKSYGTEEGDLNADGITDGLDLGLMLVRLANQVQIDD